MSLNLLYILKSKWPKISKFDFPLDGNLTFFGQPLLGKSTTWPGLVVAIAAGHIVGSWLYGSPLVGFLAAQSVYLGHALGSFIKRRLHKADGQFMLGVDHGDYIILTGIIFGLVGLFSWQVIVLGILLTYLLHPLVTYLSYKLGLHKYPW